MVTDPDDDLKARLAVEAKFPGWQVHRPMSDRWVRYKPIRAGEYYAVHWRLSEAPVTADDLDGLTLGITTREANMSAERRWADRTALSRIIPLL